MTKFLQPTFTLLLFSFIALVGLSTSLQAQNPNLLMNPNFEAYTTCPTGLSQSTNLTNWSLGSSSPEYYNCSFSGNSVIAGAPSDGSGSLGVWGGPSHPSCTGGAYSESVVGNLSSGMVTGKAYEVTFDLQIDGVGTATGTANNCVDFGFYFYDQNNAPILSGFCCKPVTPQIAVNGGSVMMGSYQTFVMTFTASGTFDRVLVGTYCNSMTADPACANYYANRMYFNIDNISVQEAKILPVAYTRLEGKAIGNRNQLEWETASETLNDYFEVEKCTGDCDNSANFAKIGTVTAAGNAQNGMNYRFYDELPIVGSNYYRLKQVDINGAYSYSRILEIGYGKDLSSTEVFPNPTENQATLRMALPMNAIVSIEVVDASGRILKKETTNRDAGVHEMPIDLTNRPEGFYFLKTFAEYENGESTMGVHPIIKK